MSRILLIDGANRPVDPPLVDLLGLTFDIEPEFFLALLVSYPWWNEWNTMTKTVDVPSRYYKPNKFLLLPNFVFKFIKSIDIGPARISLGLTFIRAKWDPQYTYRFVEYIKGTPSIFGWEREYAPRVTHPTTLEQIRASIDTQDNEDSSWSHIFAQWFAHNYRSGGPSSSNIPLLHCLQLLGRLQISRNQSYTLTVTRDLRNWKSEHDELEDHEDPLVEVWREIRVNLETHKSFVRAFRCYTSRNFDPKEAEGFFEDLHTEQDDVTADLLVVESEFKDILQMQVGSLSLAESRKSIEMSKKSIEEGKRIKLLTMLAFFFIPVSLATSIYGMNLQQINQTGHDIWAFVITAVAIVVVALLAWALSLLINSAWTNWRDPRRYYPSREYDSFWHRCKMIVYLFLQGHTVWMIKTGGLLALLTNFRYGSHQLPPDRWPINSVLWLPSDHPLHWTPLKLEWVSWKSWIIAAWIDLRLLFGFLKFPEKLPRGIHTHWGPVATTWDFVEWILITGTNGRVYRSHSENGHSLGRRTPRTEEYEHGSLHERRSSRREQRTSLQDEQRSLHTGRSSQQEEHGSFGDHDNFRTPRHEA